MRHLTPRPGTVFRPDSCKGLGLQLGPSASGGQRFSVPTEAEIGQPGFERGHSLMERKGNKPVGGGGSGL
jgi:hypothetical protein